jgi:hypothetical protein
MVAKGQVIYEDPEISEPAKKRTPPVVKIPAVIPRIKKTRTVNGSAPQATAPPPPSRAQVIKKEEDKVQDLLGNARTALYKCKAVFPFDLFPDELSIEPNQVNIRKNFFFFTSRESSIPLKNIADAIVRTTPFFASLQIVDQNFVENSTEVQFLWKRDAEKARQIIQGLIILSKEGVDVSKLDSKTLRSKLEAIGKMEALNDI